MELSIRDAKACFAKAATTAACDDHVVVTKHGRPFVGLIPFEPASGLDFEKAALVRCELGLDGLDVMILPDFDDPALSRQVLGLVD